MSIKHYKNGKWEIIPGTTAPGRAPKMGIKDTFWTADGELVLDENGNPVSAVGKDGAPGKDGKDGAPGIDGKDGVNGHSGYLTDSMGVVSCDANGAPTEGQTLSTEFKITNAKSVTIDGIFTDKDCTNSVQNGSMFDYAISEGIVTFSNFKSTLPETSHLYLKASYTDVEGTEAIEGDVLGYTIAKLKVAEASTVLAFSNSNIVVPCDENGVTKLSEVVTYVAMMHGDETLNLTMQDQNGVTFDDAVENGYHKLTIAVDSITFNGDIGYCTMQFTGSDDNDTTYNRTGQVILSKVKAGESGHIWDLVLSTNSPKFNNDTDKFDDDYVEGWINVWSANDTWEIASYNTLAAAGRYIVHRANDVTDATYSPLAESDFTEGRFKIYINPDKPEGCAFEDLDSNTGVEIALAELKGEVYVPIQSEIVRASYDGRDFSKFELVLSVENITRTYQDTILQTTSPNKIDIVGIYEHEGPKKLGITNVNNIHNHHVSGLDVYYGVDLDLTNIDISDISTEYLTDLTLLSDTGEDGMITNDYINIENLSKDAEYLNVLLIAHYDDPDVEENATKLQLVDHKAIKIVRVDLPDTLLNYRISLDQDSIIVPVDGAYVVDPDFTVTVSPKLYSNDDLVSDDKVIKFYYAFSSDFNAPVDVNAWTDFENSVSLSSEMFAEKYSYIWFKYEYNLDDGKTTSVSKACQILYSKNPVEIIVDKKTVKRDIYTGLINDTVSLEIKKWDYTNNVWTNTTGYTVKLECNTDADDSNEISETINPLDNKYTVNFKNVDSEGNYIYKNVRYIKFSVYNSDDGLLGFENVSVLTDGVDGDSQEFLYYRCNVNYTGGGLPAPDKIDSVNIDNYQNAEWKPDKTHEGIGWTDDPTGVTVNNMYEYVSTRKKKLGTWESFSTPSLWAKYGEKGVQGDRGADGTSVTIKGSFNTLGDFENAFGSNAEGKPTITYDGNVVDVGLGDGYLVSGDLYVCKNVSIDFDECWENVGPIKGESAYINLRFSNNSDGSNMWDPDDGRGAGKYIGIKVTDHDITADEDKPENYAWSKWSGDDGWGYEQVFILTTDHYNENKIPPIEGYQDSYNQYIDQPVYVKDTPDNMNYYGSSEWADLPLTPTEEHPYCWQMTRKGTDGQMPAWEKISLYNRYVKDGKDASFEIFRVHNQMDQIYVDIDNKPFANTEITTKLSVLTENGEQNVNADDISISGLPEGVTGDITNSILTFTLKPDNVISNDLTITVTYKGTSAETMLVKKMQGVVEYSLHCNRGFVRAGTTDTVNTYIVHKLVGSTNSLSTKKALVPKGYIVQYIKDDAVIKEFGSGKSIDQIYASDLQENEVIEIRLLNGDTLVDRNRIEVVANGNNEEIKLILKNSTHQLYIDETGHLTSIDSLTDNPFDSVDTIGLLYGPDDLIPTENIFAQENFEYSIKFEDDKITPYDNGSCENFLGIKFHRGINTDEQTSKFSPGDTTTVTYGIKYNDNWYFADQTIVFLLSKTEYSLSVNPVVFKYEDGKAVADFYGRDEIYVQLWYENENVWDTKLTKIPKGYSLIYGYITMGTDGKEVYNNISTFDSNYNAGEGYKYLILDEVGGAENSYTRYVQFCKGDTVIDEQRIYPIKSGENAKHLELSNPFALVHLDPNNQVIDDIPGESKGQIISTDISFFDGNKEVNIDKKDLMISDFIGSIQYFNGEDGVDSDSGTITKVQFTFTDNAADVPQEITFDYLGHKASLVLSTSGSWDDYDLVVDTVTVLDNGTSYEPSTITVGLTKKTIGQTSKVETITEIPEDYSLTYNNDNILIGKLDLSYPNNEHVICLKKGNTIIDQTNIRVYKNGADGVGKRGRIAYSAGKWDEGIVYEVTNNAAPYVEHTYINGETSITKNFVLFESLKNAGIEPQDDPDHWEEMATFNSVFTDLIVAKYGTVGGAVFYNDDCGNYFMFSQSGIARGGNTLNAYEQFLKIDESTIIDISKIKTIFGLERAMDGSLFKPNMLINLTTGDAWFGQGSLIVSNDGRSYINGQISASTGIASQTFQLGVDDNSLVIDGRNIELYNNMSLNNQNIIMFIGGTVATDISGDQISYDQTLGWNGNQSAVEDANVKVTYASDTEYGGLKFITEYNSDLYQILKENFKYKITLKNEGPGVIALPYTLSNGTQVPLYILPNESVDYMLSISTMYGYDDTKMELIGDVVSEVSIIDGEGTTKLIHGGYDIYTNLFGSTAKLVDGTLTYSNNDAPNYCCVLKRTNRGSVNSGQVIC